MRSLVRARARCPTFSVRRRAKGRTGERVNIVPGIERRIPRSARLARNALIALFTANAFTCLLSAPRVSRALSYTNRITVRAIKRVLANPAPGITLNGDQFSRVLLQLARRRVSTIIGVTFPANIYIYIRADSLSDKSDGEAGSRAEIRRVGTTTTTGR